MGIPGSGTSTTLASLALTLAAEHRPEDLDLLVLDLGSRDLAPLAGLPHTAAYVGSGAAAREQQVRLLKYVRAELDRRRAAPGPHRRTVVLVDGLAALKDEYDDFEGLKLLEGLYRAYSDGPEVGLWCVATTTRAKAVPSAIDEVTTQKWLFRLADQYDYAAAGVPAKFAPAAVAGRCVIAETRLQAHVATPSTPLAEAVTLVAGRWGPVPAKPTVVGQLPESVSVAELGVSARVGGEPWQLPVGVRESDLAPAVLESYEGEHVLVAGPARSGKSTLLLAIAETLRAGAAADGVPLAIWGAGRASFAAGGRRPRPVRRRRRRTRRAAGLGPGALGAAGPAGRRRRAVRRRGPGHRRPDRGSDGRPQGGRRRTLRRPALALQPLDQDGAQVAGRACCSSPTSTTTASCWASPSRAARPWR